MLGDQLGEAKGKRIVRRVLSVDPLTVEVSFEDSGQLLGVGVNGLGTYTSAARADGSLYGEGQGASITQDGEVLTWTGSGLGSIAPGGAISYRGMLYYRTSSQKLARMNNTSVVFEYDVDAAGNTTSRIWEWKASQGALGKSA